MYFALQRSLFSLNPELTVLLFAAGAIAINVEFLRPGSYVSGAIGSALCLIAVARMVTLPMPVASLVFAGGALLAFILQWQRRWRIIPGAVGTMLWAAAIRSYGLSVLSSLLIALPYGALLTLSLLTAHQSRAAKRNVIKIVVDGPNDSPHNKET